jgi:hypothetical protein
MLISTILGRPVFDATTAGTVWIPTTRQPLEYGEVLTRGLGTAWIPTTRQPAVTNAMTGYT